MRMTASLILEIFGVPPAGGADDVDSLMVWPIDRADSVSNAMSQDKQWQAHWVLPRWRLALEGGLSNDYPERILLRKKNLPVAPARAYRGWQSTGFVG